MTGSIYVWLPGFLKAQGATRVWLFGLVAQRAADQPFIQTSILLLKDFSVQSVLEAWAICCKSCRVQ